MPQVKANISIDGSHSCSDFFNVPTEIKMQNTSYKALKNYAIFIETLRKFNCMRQKFRNYSYLTSWLNGSALDDSWNDFYLTAENSDL